MKYKIGIDPGIVNFGLAILREDDSLEVSYKLTPHKFSSLDEFIDSLNEILTPYLKDAMCVGVEKYVIYGRGTPAKSAIDTIMLVGALSYYFHTKGLDCQLYRAIDWKKKSCKHLFKTQGFKNPSTKFDKKFSMACSLQICKEEVETDHEADAVGIAFTSSLEG